MYSYRADSDIVNTKIIILNALNVSGKLYVLHYSVHMMTHHPLD